MASPVAEVIEVEETRAPAKPRRTLSTDSWEAGCAEVDRSADCSIAASKSARCLGPLPST